jgi:hypothetical protein
MKNLFSNKDFNNNFWYFYFLDKETLNIMKNKNISKNVNKNYELRKRLDLFEFPMAFILGVY